MTRANYIRLYSAGDAPDAAYLLGSGTMYFFSSQTDRYAIKGTNLIVGATELILGSAAGVDTVRLETAVMEQGSQVKKISAGKFIDNLDSYSFILNTCMVLAKQVSLTNEIISRNIEAMREDDRKLKEISVEYYRTIASVRKEYDKRKLPYLKEIIVKFENSLVYKRGEAFDRSLEPERVAPMTTMKDRYRDIAPGEMICQEGTAGDEMYVLHSGTLEVLIGGNQVATLSEPGTIIGEMALLLGEKRTASLRSKNNVVITGITKNDLKEIAEKERGLFLSIAISLAKKHYFNIDKIHRVNELVIEKELEGRVEDVDKKMQELNKSRSELSSLKNEVEKLIDTKGADYLQGLV